MNARIITQLRSHGYHNWGEGYMDACRGNVDSCYFYTQHSMFTYCYPCDEIEYECRS